MGSGEPAKELVPNGDSKMVTKENYQEYISLAVRAHLHKDSLQMKYFLKGFHIILPQDVISMISWRYAEVRAMGERIIDIEVLKKFTHSSNDIKQEVKDWFWEVMTEMDEDDKKLYLKFVNGRSKMPTDMSQISYKHQLCFQHGGDEKMPQAHVW